ncbi:carbohydrate ABC transporter permease, partial [Rhizobium ecuadorense]
FWSALGVTFLYFFIALVFEIILGMAIAMLLDAELPGFSVLRATLSMTLVIPPAIAGMMFLLMEDPQFGVLPYLLNTMGLLDKSTPILATSSLALAGVLVAEIWQWTPFMVLIFMAGLRSLPAEPYEAAMIDGASSFQMFRRLTLPMMSK